MTDLPVPAKQSRWLFPAVTFLLLMIMFARTPLDTDMWWHLRAGEVSWTTRTPLLVDVFSHTVIGKAWINHSWLAQVFLYLTYKIAGMKALAVLIALVGAVTMLILYKLMVGSPPYKAFIIIFGALVAAPVLSPRPQIFSLLLLAILSFIIFENRVRDHNYYFIIPIIFIFWSNLHAGYVIGLIFLGAWFVGELINFVLAYLMPREEKLNAIASARKHAWQLLIWTSVGGLATILNPNGIKIWLVPFQTVGLGVLQDLIPEWASPNFHNIFEQPFIWMLIACFVAIGLANKRLGGPEILTFGIFAYMALLSRRNFGPFAIIATPLLAKYGWEVISAYRVPINEVKQTILRYFHWENFRKVEVPNILRIGINGFIICLLAVIAVGKILYVTAPAIVGGGEESIFPVNAVDWISGNPVEGEIFNSYNWGGYLIWNLRGMPVFIDGRTDLYGDKILQDYLTIQEAGINWQRMLEQYRVNSVLTETNSTLSEALRSEPGWVQAYQDALAVIFVRRTP